MTIKWNKKVHIVYKDFLKLKKSLLEIKCPIGKYHYLSEPKGFSIISPAMGTFNMYELFDGEEIKRFDTLKKAKQYANSINNT